MWRAAKQRIGDFCFRIRMLPTQADRPRHCYLANASLSVFLSDSVSVNASDPGSLLLLRPMVLGFLLTTGFTKFVSVAGRDASHLRERVRVKDKRLCDGTHAAIKFQDSQDS